ncbi:MAG: beta strand repeat-containing protein, partial [Planctomycetia bacterium]
MAVVSAICNAVPAARAADFTWIGTSPTGTAWSTAGNWMSLSGSPSLSVPGVNDVAYFSGTFAVNPNVGTTATPIQGLVFSGSNWRLTAPAGLQIGSAGISLKTSGNTVTTATFGVTGLGASGTLTASQTWNIGDGVANGGTAAILTLNRQIQAATATPNIDLRITGGGLVLVMDGLNNTPLVNIGSGTFTIDGNSAFGSGNNSNSQTRPLFGSSSRVNIASGIVVNQTSGNLAASGTIRVAAGGAYIGRSGNTASVNLTNNTNVLLTGGYFTLSGASGTQTLTSVTADGGNSLFGYGSAGLSISISDLVRSNRGTLILTGTSLVTGAGTGTMAVTNINGASAAGALVGGGGNSASTTQSILPWAVGSGSTQPNITSGTTSLGDTFVTHDGTALRVLSASNYATSLGGNATDNVRISANTTGAASATVNSLLLASSAATGSFGLAGNAGATLTITSGALMFSGTGYATSNQTRVNTGTISGFDSLVFGSVGTPREAIITVNALNNSISGSSATVGQLRVSSAITTADGLTKAGAGRLILAAANSYSGTTTVNSGELVVGIQDALPVGTQVVLNGGVGVQSGTIMGLGVLPDLISTTTNLSSRVNVANTFLDLNGFNQRIAGITGPSGSAGGAIGIVTNNGGSASELEVTGNSTFDGQLRNGSSALALRKSTGGLFTLTGSNNYTGATTITGGTLQIASTGRINNTSGVTINGGEFRYNSATALSQAITFSSGVLSGTGAIGVAVTVGSGDTISPGNSPGIQQYTAGLTMAVGGAYLWETNGWVGSTAGNLTNGFDQLQVSGGALDIAAGTTSGQRFTIYVSGLTSGNVAGAVSGFSPGTTGTSFIIATSASGITNFDAAKFDINTSLFTNNNTIPGGYGFTISQSGNNLVLTYGSVAVATSTYSLSGSASNSVIRVGDSTTLTASIVNAGPNSIAYNGFTLSGANALSSTTGTVSAGGTNSPTVSYTGVTTGTFTFTPAVTTATDTTTNVAAIGSGTTSGTVTVYNPASYSALSAQTLANIRVGGTFSTGTLTITNTGTASATFQEGLSAVISGSSGAATGAGSVNNTFSTGSFTFGLGGGAQLTAGVQTGSLTFGFTSTGSTSGGATGLSPLALTSATVAVTGTVFNAAAASAISGTYNVGVVLTGGTLSQGLSITNTAPNDGFSEKLNASFGSLTGVTTTGSISLLAASSTSSAMSVFLSQLSAGSGTGSAVVNFQTDGQGTSGLAAESLASQTVTLVGTFLDPATPSFTL